MNEDDVIANKYQVIKQLGSGGFGSVYKGNCLHKGITVAMKFESQTTPYKMLRREASLLKYLYDHGCRSIPVVYWYGPYKQTVCLVMGYYECSMSDYIKIKDLTINKINNILVQYVRIIQSVHTQYVIHRDIKPQNCMIKSGELFLIDFGLATFYVNEDKTHINISEPAETIVGSPKYVSFYVHDSCIPTRRDDLISLGYMYIYLYSKELPWDSVSSYGINDPYPNELYVMNAKNQQRKTLKSWDSIQPICSIINKQIEQYMGYCYQLQGYEQPNYELCVSFITET
jgi:serine/threonine protein kinase